MYKAILFDLDGTLIDSLDFHAKAYKLFLKSMNINFSEAEIKELIGHTIKIIFCATIPLDMHEEAFEKLFDFYCNKVDDLINKIPIIPFVEETLVAITNSNIPIFLVSNSQDDLVKKILQRHSLELFKDLSGADASSLDKVDRCKNILDHHGILPEQALYVGDTSTDVSAAQTVGMDSCLILNEYSWIHKENIDISLVSPTIQIESIKELLDVL